MNPASHGQAHPYGQDVRSADRFSGIVEVGQILLGVALSLLSGLAILLALGLLVALAVYLGR